MTDPIEKAPDPTPARAFVSSLVTGGITVSAASLAPLVSWALDGFPRPVPAEIPLLIAAGLITLGHALYNLAMSRK